MNSDFEDDDRASLLMGIRFPRTFIGSTERGERNVSILNLRRIAEVLRVGLAELLE